MAEAYLVEDGRAFVGRAELHLLVAEADVSTLLALLLCLCACQTCIQEQVAQLTIGSRPLAASSPCIVFCTSARLLFSADGNALGDEYVFVGRFSYAVKALASCR